jgi:large subunit ribosomal protein L23
MIIKNPLSTEKSIRLLNSENKLVFVVDRKARKPEIKAELEKLFNAKVEQLRTLIDRKGNKKVFVRFTAETPALDIATKLGLM